MREHLWRAVVWRDRMIQDQLTLAQLAEAEGVAPTRVTERVGLLRLAETILTDLADADRRGPIPTRLDVERLSRVRDRHAQVARYQRLVRKIAEGGNGRRPSMPKQREFQHVLARARQYKAWLGEGTRRSLSSAARAEGVTSGRIGDILDLLTLSPAILAAIDVLTDHLSRGTTHEELRRIGRLGDHAVQEEEVRRRWPDLLGDIVAK